MSDDRTSATASSESSKQQPRNANTNAKSDTSGDANGMHAEFNPTPHSSDREDGRVTSAWQKLRRAVGM